MIIILNLKSPCSFYHQKTKKKKKEKKSHLVAANTKSLSFVFRSQSADSSFKTYHSKEKYEAVKLRKYIDEKKGGH